MDRIRKILVFLVFFTTCTSANSVESGGYGCTIQNIGNSNAKITWTALEEEETIAENGLISKDSNCAGIVENGKVLICFIFDSYNPCIKKISSGNNKETLSFDFNDAKSTSIPPYEQNVISLIYSIFDEKVDVVTGSSRADDYSPLPPGMPYGNIIFTGSLKVPISTDKQLEKLGMLQQLPLTDFNLTEQCDGNTNVLKPKTKDRNINVFSGLKLNCSYVATGKKASSEFESNITFIDVMENYMFKDFPAELNKIESLNTSKLVKNYFKLNMLKNYTLHYEAELLALSMAKELSSNKEQK